MNSVKTITLFKLYHKHLFFVNEISNNSFKYCQNFNKPHIWFE